MASKQLMTERSAEGARDGNLLQVLLAGSVLFVATFVLADPVAFLMPSVVAVLGWIAVRLSGTPVAKIEHRPKDSDVSEVEWEPVQGTNEFLAKYGRDYN